MEVFVVCLLLACNPAGISKNESLSFGQYFFLSDLISPLLGFIIAWVASPNKSVREKEIPTTGMKKCDYCVRLVKYGQCSINMARRIFPVR